MLDDFDRYNRQGDQSARSSLKTFTPKFDLKELKDAYELHGELPGIEQKDIDIEFSDMHTLTVKGHTERSYTSGTPPAGFIESGSPKGAITEAEDTQTAHKATVEDEGAESSTEVVKQEEPQVPKDETKYWVSERSVGSFSRSFTFPQNVDQDNVTASMKNGILSIHVPKAKKPESRKITIS